MSIARARGISLVSCGALALLLPLAHCGGSDATNPEADGGVGAGDSGPMLDGTTALLDSSSEDDAAETMDSGDPGNPVDAAVPVDSASPVDSGASDASDGGNPSDASDAAIGPVTLHGAIAKGPFINGSTVNVAPIDLAGNPTGQTFPTTTLDDIGTFSVVFTYQGPVQLTANGYYYNEIAGALSASQLTLNGYASITQSGSQNAYINLITHLTHNRIKTLLAGGTALPAAVTQAESELRAQFPVGGMGFDPGASGTQLNLVGGDTLQSEYIFAVSSIIAEASQLSTVSGGTDAKLQSFLNTFASDFSAGGALPAATKTLLANAQSCVEPADVKVKLAARYASIVSSTAVPNIDKALDSDGDNVVNAIDTCPLIANAAQGTIPNGICNYKAITTPTASTPSSFSGSPATITGNIDGVKGTDLLYLLGTNLYVWLNDGTATFAAPFADDLSSLLGAGAGTTINLSSAQILDMDSDGKADMFLQFSLQSSGPPSGTKLAYLKGDGTGHFTSLVTVYQQGVADAGMPQQPFMGYSYVAVGDFNGDTVPDVAGADYGGPNGIALVLSQGSPTSPTWAAPVTLAMAPVNQGLAFFALAAVNVDGDAYMDLVATADSQGGGPGGVYFIKGSATGLVAPAGPSNVVGAHVYNLAVGDYDGDNKPDFLVAESAGLNQTSTLQVIWGDATFNPTTVTTVSTASTSVCAASNAFGGSSIPIAAGDANGDGRSDIVLSSVGSILIADGTRSFLAPLTIDLTPGVGGGSHGATPGGYAPPPLVDFNGDGHADLFAQGYAAMGTNYNIGLINLAGNNSW